MKIGFDLDGTIIDHNNTKVRMCLDRGRKIELWEANSNIFENAVGGDIYREISHSLYKEKIADGKVFPGALEALRLLKSFGHEIFIVSARYPDSCGCAIDWLKDNGFLLILGSNYVYFCKESEKPAILERLGIKLYVDDKLSVLQTLPRSVTKVLFDDQSLVAAGKISLPGNISAAANWNEVKKIIGYIKATQK